MDGVLCCLPTSGALAGRRHDLVETWCTLLRRMSFARSFEERDELLKGIVSLGAGTRIVSFVNVYGVMLTGSDPVFRDAILNSDFILRDGVGAKVLCKAAELEPGLNLHGTDLIPVLLEMLDRGCSIGIMGTAEPILENARRRLLDMGFKRVRTIDGFHADCKYIECAESWKPDVLILAMGMPKQERVASLIKSKLPSAGILIINGGAIVDYMGGGAVRAPALMCRLGLEWLYRLLRYPRRMWKRNLSTVRFLVLVAINKKKLRDGVRKGAESGVG